MVLRDDPVIIIGIGTSGTRMVMRMLEKCGIFMGGRESENEWAEPPIFFEEINSFTDDFRYHVPLRPDWRTVVSQHRGRIRDICCKRLPNYYREAGYLGGPWGFKDPRSTFTVAILLELFPRAKVLHVVRDGLDVAESKQREEWGNLPDGRDINYWLIVWAQVVEVAHSWQTIVPSQYLETQYEKLCQGNKTTLHALADFVGVTPVQLESAQSAICHTKRIQKVSDGALPFLPRHIQELRHELGYC